MADCLSLKSIRLDVAPRVFSGEESHRCVYLLKKQKRGCAGYVYVGITNDFHGRVLVHKRKNKIPKGFVARKITGYIAPSLAAKIESMLVERYSADESRICVNSKAGGSLGCAVRENDWTEENVRAESKKWSKLSDFISQRQSAYNAATRLGIREEVCAHMQKSRKFWTVEAIKNEALKYKTKKEFKQNSSCYAAAIRNSILKEVTQHMVGERRRYTHEEIYKEAKKYSLREDFKKGSDGHYQAALRRGIYQDACSHMDINLVQWTKEMISKEAKKYISRTEFSTKRGSAYKAALRMGLLDEVCAHMNYRGLKNFSG